MRRRDFIRTSIAGAGALTLGCQQGDDSAAAISCHDPAERVALGRTDINLSRVGLGTGTHITNFTSNQVKLGADKLHQLIRGCYERGIRWFDCADAYGCHPYLFPALRDLPRKDYVLVSKVWVKPGSGLPHDARPDADQVVERFLRELKTDYIDLILLHGMDQPDWTSRYTREMLLLERMKQKGCVRALGVSCHCLPALKLASEELWVESVHTRINPYGVYMDDEPSKVIPVIQRIHRNGKGVIGMKILGSGQFGDDEEKKMHSIDQALNLGCIDAMTIGFESLDQVDDFSHRVRRTPRRGFHGMDVAAQHDDAAGPRPRG